MDQKKLKTDAKVPKTDPTVPKTTRTTVEKAQTALSALGVAFHGKGNGSNAISAKIGSVHSAFPSFTTWSENVSAFTVDGDFVRRLNDDTA